MIQVDPQPENEVNNYSEKQKVYTTTVSEYFI